MSETDVATTVESATDSGLEVDTDDGQCLVTEFRLHKPSRWVCDLVDRLMTLASLTVAETLAQLQSQIHYEFEPDNKTIKRVLLNLVLPVSFRDRISNLIDPNRKPVAPGKSAPRVLTSYGFISVADGPMPGTILAPVRLMERVTTDKVYTRGPLKGQPQVTIEKIAVTTGLQQLIASFIKPPGLLLLPRDLQQGVAQEIGQQLMSHVMLKVSGEIEEANFPSVEDRNPARRRDRYQTALAQASRKTEPFNRLPYAQAHPERFARIAKRDPEAAVKLANKLVIADPVWDLARTTPHPPRTPLLFVSWKPVQILYGEKEVEAGVGRSDVARGIDKVANLPEGKPTYKTPLASKDGHELSDRARRLNVEQLRRRERLDKRGKTVIRKYFVHLPIVNTDDPVVAKIITDRDHRLSSQHHAQAGQSGRGWDFQLHSLEHWGGKRFKRKPDSVIVPLEIGKTQEQDILRGGNVKLCWWRLVRKPDGFYVQLTYRRQPDRTMPARNVLGVHLGIDNIVHWCLTDKTGTIQEQGAFAGNPQLNKLLETAGVLSYDQKAGRWIGGRGYGKALRTMTYNLVHRLADLAKRKEAILAVEDIAWVDKAGRTLEANRRFSGWNYGQMRRILDYKGPMLGIGEVAKVSDYVTNLTCPDCGAIRKPKQKPESADTHLSRDGVLHCRKCNKTQVVPAATKAVTVARTALKLVATRLS